MTYVPFPLAALVRWIGLVALAAVIGGLSLDLLVLPAGARELAAMRRRQRRWIGLGAAALILATGAELLVRASTMSGGPLDSALAAVPAVLTRTHFGAIWIARTAALIPALFLGMARTPWLRASALLLSAGIALTTSLTGHAGDWGDLTLSVVVDWIHVLASAVWTGGLGAMAAVVLAERATWPAALLPIVARRFSRLAGLCLAVVVASGGYTVWAQVGALEPLWATAYGRLLDAKVLVVLGLACLGAVNRCVTIPRLDPSRRSDGIASRWFRRARLALCGPSRVPRHALPSRLAAFVGREAMLAVLVLALTATLSALPPARHARHAQHPASAAADGGPFRVTMQGLHDSGGVPKGWIFTPPSGDAARGRRVFARLECFACHRVQGEGFPAPSGPGPDLTGMGAHHPAGYVAESILNPNAVIVEGPGYTGPDGLSIMPDYRRSLTAEELIDLVAYLKGR